MSWRRACHALLALVYALGIFVIVLLALGSPPSAGASLAYGTVSGVAYLGAWLIWLVKL